jgi:hypothetical protein
VIKLALIPIEGPEKAIRGGGGGGEWESIKIPRGNLTFVSNLIRRASLLARSRAHNYRKASGPQNWVRQLEIALETQQDANKATSKHDDDQNQTNMFLTASRIFHRTPCVHY